MEDLDDLETIVEARDIAVIGMAGRFPKAQDLEQFWQNLKDGVEGVVFFDDEALAAAGVPPELINDPNYVKAGVPLAGIEEFDASFFGYNPQDATILDPQQRVFLEQAWHALEAAGYDPNRYDGPIGVYAGAAWNTYLLSNLATNRELFDASTIFQLFISNDKDFMPTRVSYKLNLKGPSLIIQTSCSTSLVAIHMACLSLLNYECDMALAGGVTIKVPQTSGYYYVEGSLASPDGHCRTFDAQGRGTIFGSGVGVVVLKRLSEAIADGDNILAVVKGTAVNNDGSVKVSYTAPSVEGQAEVIAAAQAIAGVTPDTIRYIEAHGTATSLGDPIEVTALTKVFAAGTDKKEFCAIGSVKSNLGHLDAAAGVAGFIKTVLSLQHKTIPPSLHYETANPAIDFPNTPFYVNTKLADWSQFNGTRRRAGVSSFGVGGTNAHVILEEAPTLDREPAARSHYLLLLSAKTASALAQMQANLADHLQKYPDQPLADVAYTLQVGRGEFDHRAMLVCGSRDEAIAALRDGQVTKASITANTDTAPVVFMFTGQGAQHVRMAQDLYATESVFQEQVDRCAHILQPLLGLDIRQLLYPGGHETAEATPKLNQTRFTQPALFVIEYALAQLWMSWGIQPHAMIGHSVGEYVAACLAQVMSLEDALKLVARRGALMQELPPGAMLAVALPAPEVERMLTPQLSIAAANGPTLTVVSGPPDAVQALNDRLTTEGVICRSLHTSHAFHSSMMDPILDSFRAQFERITLAPPQIPFISNYTGTWIAPEEATSSAYWVNHLRHTVQFSQGLEELFRNPDWILLEVGPGRTLSALARQHPFRSNQQLVLASMRHPQDEQHDLAFIMQTLGQLWLAGRTPDWQAFYQHENRRRQSLPLYPFERQRYWIEAGRTASLPAQAQPGKRQDVRQWLYLPSWQRTKLPSNGKPTEPRHWLIFKSDSEVCAELIRQLEQAGHQVTRVEPGSQYQKQTAQRFTIDPQQADHYRQLIQALENEAHLPETVVHFWSHGAEDSHGYYSLLFLAQALAPLEQVQLEVISHYLQQVAGEPTLNMADVPVLGLSKVITQEHPNIVCRHIDIERPQTAITCQKLAYLLLTEMVAPAQDRLVAYRNQQRWVPAFTPLPPQDTMEDGLRPRGIYFLTEGLNGIGYLLAQHLAKTYQARLILLNPDESDARFATLREMGAIIYPVFAELTDAAALQAALRVGHDHFGGLHGVLHTAGITGEKSFRTIQETGREESEWHFQAKVAGTQALDKALANYELDFCLLSSSLSSLLGGRGYGAYTASNLYLDAFVHCANQHHTFPWLSVNWDVWLEEGADNITLLNPEIAQFAMTPDEVGAVFTYLLAHKLTPQIILSTGDLPTRLAYWEQHLLSRHLATAESFTQPTVIHPRPNLQTPYVAPGNEVERAIAQIWQETLGFERVGVQDNFFELGGDSLIAMQVINRLKKKLDIDIPAAKLYQSLTIAALAQVLSQDEAQVSEQKAVALDDRRAKMDQRKQRQQQIRQRQRG